MYHRIAGLNNGNLFLIDLEKMSAGLISGMSSPWVTDDCFLRSHMMFPWCERQEESSLASLAIKGQFHHGGLTLITHMNLVVLESLYFQISSHC